MPEDNRRRRLAQGNGGNGARFYDLGVHIVPEYLGYQELKSRLDRNELELRTISECGNLTLAGSRGSSLVLILGPNQEVIQVDEGT